ncbi:D-aminoacyl-tRNA deacylase [Timonella senegalensis]|uniref:D-aminoacyl-tRNA deacylase n=1 Tax=Timonella senegalensis TaxID=1465825 RepID=UPI0028B08449|nr:D-aminoacyl-tRNA deacylase [Timonella senegalensis]
MRAVLQRARNASVTVDGEVVSSFTDQGLVVLVGVTHEDGQAEVDTIVRKVAELRVLDDEKSASDVNAPIIVVSQFTLYADVKKGRRPSWNGAAKGDVAEPLVAAVVDGLRARNLTVGTGVFGAHMDVAFTNDGPVTILLET